MTKLEEMFWHADSFPLLCSNIQIFRNIALVSNYENCPQCLRTICLMILFTQIIVILIADMLIGVEIASHQIS